MAIHGPEDWHNLNKFLEITI